MTIRILFGFETRKIFFLAKITPTKFVNYAAKTQTRGLWANDEFLFFNRYKIPLDEPNNILENTVEKVVITATNVKDELWQSKKYKIINTYSNDGILHPPIVTSSDFTGSGIYSWAYSSR